MFGLSERQEGLFFKKQKDHNNVFLSEFMTKGMNDIFPHEKKE